MIVSGGDSTAKKLKEIVPKRHTFEEVLCPFYLPPCLSLFPCLPRCWASLFLNSPSCNVQPYHRTRSNYGLEHLKHGFKPLELCVKECPLIHFWHFFIPMKVYSWNISQMCPHRLSFIHISKGERFENVKIYIEIDLEYVLVILSTLRVC